jgi:glutathione S-transferase
VTSTLDPTPPTLLSLRYSPWSERARWALDHHGIAYRLLQHEPFLGERRLRKLAGKHVQRPTAPLLISGDEVLRDSWDIALYADRHGSAEKLVPAELEAQIKELNALAERTMTDSRGLVTAALLANPALDEALPKFVPGFLRPLLRPVSRFGTRWFARKYALDLVDLERQRGIVAGTLSEFRARYAGRPYLFDRFTNADVIFTSLLQGIAPVDNRYIRLGPAWRAAWTQPTLAAEFEDLVHLRDRIYDNHRGSRRKAR